MSKVDFLTDGDPDATIQVGQNCWGPCFAGTAIIKIRWCGQWYFLIGVRSDDGDAVYARSGTARYFRWDSQKMHEISNFELSSFWDRFPSGAQPGATEDWYKAVVVSPNDVQA